MFGTRSKVFLEQHRAHHVHRDRVETGQRLVEHEHVGIVHRRGSELHALLVAEAERDDRIVNALVDAEVGEPPLDGARRSPWTDPCSWAR